MRDRNAQRMAGNHHMRGLARTAFFRILLFTVFTTGITLSGHASHAEGTPTVIGTQPILEQVTDFKAQPLAILAKFPDAGSALAGFIAKLAVDQPGIMDAVLSIVETSSPEQASAIGAGLIRACRVLVKRNPELVQSLTKKILQSDNRWLKTTFMALGLNYNFSVHFVSPPIVSPAALSTVEIGSIPILVEGRIGPQQKTTITPIPLSPKSPENVERIRHGMIVAVIRSGPSENGAFSTSPTN